MKFMRSIYSIPTSSYSASPMVCERKQKFSFRSLVLLASMFFGMFLTGCASENLKAPCPDYGKHCDQTPVNSWDTTTV